MLRPVVAVEDQHPVFPLRFGLTGNRSAEQNTLPDRVSSHVALDSGYLDRIIVLATGRCAITSPQTWSDVKCRANISIARDTAGVRLVSEPLNSHPKWFNDKNGMTEGIAGILFNLTYRSIETAFSVRELSCRVFDGLRRESRSLFLPALVGPGSGIAIDIHVGATGNDVDINGLQGRGILFRRGLPWQHRDRGRLRLSCGTSTRPGSRMIVIPVHFRFFSTIVRKRIARNLAGGKDPVPAHEDARCLACHTTPRPERRLKETAWMNSGRGRLRVVPRERGKVAGHSHRRAATGNRFRRIDKQNDFGFMDTKNLVRRIELCAGCHVGQDARDGFPARDVNHDLIAAGHPRLNFEFAAYQENQPKHWKPDAVEAAADFPAQGLGTRPACLGQGRAGTSAQSVPLVCRPGRRRCHRLCPGSLSTPSPWPEFAEYGCFSCHHSLADEPWRRNRPPPGVPPGAAHGARGTIRSPAHSAANSAVRNDVVVKQYQSALGSLVHEMSRPMPNPDKAKSSAEAGINALDALIREFSVGPASSRSLDASGVEHLIEVLNRREAWSKVANWDEAAQRYLALVPLNQARGRWDSGRRTEHKALSEELRTRLKSLTFPNGFDSPRGFDPSRLPARQNERSDVPVRDRGANAAR